MAGIKKTSTIKISTAIKACSICLSCLIIFSVFANPFNNLTPKEQKRIEAWENLLKKSKIKNELGILKKTNAFFNKLEFIADTPMMSSADDWLTPYEFLIKGGGDCEDFAIAKYFTAKSLGISKDKLRITYVIIKNRNQAHMILTYYPQPGAEPLILDNINKTILPASKRPDLKPVYSFSIDDVWLQERMDKSSRYSDATSLSKWQALLKRFEEQSRLRNKQ